MAEREASNRPDELGNPFGAPPKGFFAGGDRKTHLEQLRHLSQWSRRVLLVTGPRGVGKTALYRTLSASLEPRAKAARISAAQVTSRRALLNAMVHGFGLAAPAEADSQLLQLIVAEHAQAQEQSDRFCAALIDDAELLEARALEQLIALASRSPLRLVLFGEVRLVPAVERVARPLELGWHEIRLTGFDEAGVRDYLDWRMREMGHEGPLPFSDAQVKDVARLSEGLPGRIDQMANVLLARIQAGDMGEGLRRFPAVHTAVVAALVVLVGLAYLLLQPSAEPADAVTRTETLELPPAAEAAPVKPAPAKVAPAKAAPPEAAPAEKAAAEPAFREEPDVEQAVTVADSPRPVAERPAAEQVSAAPAEPAPVESKPAEESVASVPPAATPAPPGPRDATWIMRQSPEHYTLQLVSVSSAERAASYVTSQPDPGDFAVYRLQRDGRILHVVIFGSFPSREAAEQAARKLPASIGQVKPWLRTFGQVQAGVRTALQG